MDQQSRELKRAWKLAERDAARKRFPLDSAELEALFNAVDLDLQSRPCDHSRRCTETWLRDRGHDVERVLEWLDEHGGFCDCEVIANAEEHFKANR